MKIFQTALKLFSSCGFTKNESAFNGRQLFLFSICVVALVFQFMYLFRVADTPKQYMDSIFMTAVGFLVFISHVGIVFKTAMMFDVLDDIEVAANYSECNCFIIIVKLIHREKTILGRKNPKSKAMFERTNRLTETICKIIQFLIIYLSVPAFVLPTAVYSFYMYFTTDLGNDAFVLTFPTW